MRGVILTELKKFLVDSIDLKTWREILNEAGLHGPVMHVDAGSYEDSELEAIIAAAVRLTSQSRDTLLEAYGESLGAALLAKYSFLIKPEWNAEDVLMNAEHAIHQVVRARHADAEPPGIAIEKVRSGEFRMKYTSKRNLLAVAKGIIKAVAKHYGRKVIVTSKQPKGEPGELHIYLCFDIVPKYLLKKRSPQTENPESKRIDAGHEPQATERRRAYSGSS